MTEYRIPLTSVPQSFSVSLAGTEYKLTLRFSDAAEAGWVLDIDKPDNAGHVICGIPLVTGVDLLEPYAYLGISGSLVVWSEDHDSPPTMIDLGSGVDLLFVTDGAEEVA